MLTIKDDMEPLVMVFVDWYKSPESPNIGHATDKETGLPVIEPMSKAENNRWSRWVFSDNIEPVNIMLGKLPETRGYFAIRMGQREEL